MDLRWDLLRPVMCVPYFPTLGPLHPEAVSAELLAEVFAVAGTGEFLPHDKDRRWSDHKDEHVLVDAVIQDQARTLIPTITGRGILRVHLYGAREYRPEAEELAAKLAAGRDAFKARVVWFQDAADPVAASTRVQLRAFDQDAPAVEGIEALGQQPEAIRTTFPEFAEKLAGEGFVFLHSRIDSVGPVLVAVQDERVVGAIGPMETMADPIGRRRLLPQYFGVLPEHRGLGLGRLLWRSAMHWGKECGADYQLLQTAAGGASDRLCQSEGLADLGFVCTTTV
ncbi:GNAT family N-acetyltransferase [Streptomyces kaniharaensis]|uniref:GNAT family N-acetyltransferase n=1 Tax=Streptomyces kaniharaensis TaxID=212423 RepID=A0A6N7KKL0_9ACTN|nr:GNAT family N-acetyltransferase [Streptomyces kaniharaensis]MQS11996.1 GNAT family N-acetyltransferase [Streptomyces kaniharaensis]